VTGFVYSPGAAMTEASAIQRSPARRQLSAALRLRLMARPWSAAQTASPMFDALHRRGTVSDAMLYAFDLLKLEGTPS
jgi:hypothetical protein